MMKIFPLALFLAVAVPATAQTADALLQRACGPKSAEFVVQQVAKPAPTAPEPGKALVFFIQKEPGPFFTTRIGMDGAWAGVILHNSYIAVSVAPGEHHACAATLNRKHLEAELVHFNVETGKTYYYLVRGMGDFGYATMEFIPADRDEALLLIASDQQSVAGPKVQQ